MISIRKKIFLAILITVNCYIVFSWIYIFNIAFVNAPHTLLLMSLFVSIAIGVIMFIVAVTILKNWTCVFVSFPTLLSCGWITVATILKFLNM